jgi:hypothetical protein
MRRWQSCLWLHSSAAAPQVDAEGLWEPAGFPGNAGGHPPKSADWGRSANSPDSGGGADMGGEEKQQLLLTPPARQEVDSTSMSPTRTCEVDMQQEVAAYSPVSGAAPEVEEQAANALGQRSGFLGSADRRTTESADSGRWADVTDSGGQADIGGQKPQELVLTRPPDRGTWCSWTHPDQGGEHHTGGGSITYVTDVAISTSRQWRRGACRHCHGRSRHQGTSCQCPTPAIWVSWWFGRDCLRVEQTLHRTTTTDLNGTSCLRDTRRGS